MHITNNFSSPYTGSITSTTNFGKPKLRPPAAPATPRDLPRRPPREAANTVHLPPNPPMDSGRHCPSHNPHSHRFSLTLLGHFPHVKALRRQGHSKGQTTPSSRHRKLRRPLRVHSPHPHGPRCPLLCPPPQNPRRNILDLAPLRDPLPHPHREAHKNT